MINKLDYLQSPGINAICLTPVLWSPALRKQYPSIRLGNYTTMVTDDAQKPYVFSRLSGWEEVTVIVNRSYQPVIFTQAFLKKNTYKNVFTKSVGKQINMKAMDIAVLTDKF